METTLAMMSSQLPVQFVDMLDRYPCNEDIECKYIFNNYKVQEGDRIAIFRMGWKSLRNYVLFEWTIESTKADVNSVIFSRYDLPNNQADDLYQFCYISGENVVQGISTPFQIFALNPKPKAILAESVQERDKSTHLKQLLSEKDQEILQLKEENAILRESLKALVEQKNFHKSQYCSEDVDNLKELTSKLKNAILGQQKEIDAMKIEMKKDRAYNKNLLLEKIMAEKKFEAISNKNEASSIRRLPNFDLGNLQSIPAFPLQGGK